MNKIILIGLIVVGLFTLIQCSLPNLGPNPSELIKSCMNHNHVHITDYCEIAMKKKYDTNGSDAITYPTWEKCCSEFNVYNCYLLNAKSYCPPETASQLDKYARQFGAFLQETICGTIRFIGGQPSCHKSNFLANAASFNKSIEKNPNTFRSNFVKLPNVDETVARSCISKLRKFNGTTDLTANCLNKALDRWDHDRRKLFESHVQDACCTLYESINCLVEQAKLHCTADELTQITNYRSKWTSAYSNSICKSVPYGSSVKLCHK